ncbi:MAG: TusE/DsrC/DsvC family sulfur relay protein [Gammaproteobacteria bacterium]|nr:TusE/DsrC/DsvC family sulfur relay protein [Gammaproteobacteria bacterium]
MSEEQKQDFVFHVHEDEPLVSPWGREIAESLAREVNVELSDQHWDVVQMLRRYYEEMGGVEYARDLSAMLDQRYRDKGGLRYLHTLFPGGPITQGCKIAGIPLPKDSSDPSFGFSV